MPLPLFLDPALEERFVRDGFLTLPLLEAPQVERLRRFYHEQDPGDAAKPAFHYSMDHPDSGYVDRVMQELIEVIGPALRAHLHDAQLFTASFVVKESHPHGFVPPHQDWSFVDETQFRSATVWTPLMDVDMDNGALGVIHGSHRFFDGQLRASPAPQCRSVLSDHLLTLMPWLDVHPLPAGHALVFDNALIHGSPPNIGDTPRLAAGIGVTRADAGLRHHYLLPAGEPPQLETYAVEREFFTRYGNGALSELFDTGSRPAGVEAIGQSPYGLPPVSKEKMLELVSSHPRNRFDPVLEEKARSVAAHFGAGD